MICFWGFFLAVAAVLPTTLCYTTEALNDKVISLPGSENIQSMISFNQFSGYIPLGGKMMHYYFVESMNDPTNDPIAFWTNGGPGCSGLLGFFSEQGPFRPNGDMSLSFNPDAWNKISNMVFIESPCGVGFSYSDTPAVDYIANDASAAVTNYHLIQGFFRRFPEYATNDLYLTSESYGGHYLPTLAKEIVDRNIALQQQNDNLLILIPLNLKGFAVGNPYTTVYTGFHAMIETAWGHQLIAQPTYQKFRENSCLEMDTLNYQLETCEAILMEMFLQFGDLNPYALDYPVCIKESKTEVQGDLSHPHSLSVDKTHEKMWMLNHMLGNASYAMRRLFGLQSSREEILKGYEPCVSDYMSKYLNLLEVKTALHVNTEIVWKKCSSSLMYDRADGAVSMVPIYKYLLQGDFNLKILVYSGDDDGVCGTIGTQKWIWNLGNQLQVTSLPEEDEWQPYLFHGQLAGYFTIWRQIRLGFVTIRGAGHEVPTYKPKVSLDLWARYLLGDWTGER